MIGRCCIGLMVALPFATSARECDGLDWDNADVARAATIATQEPRTYFLHDAPETAGCPSADAKCRMKAYLVPGDEVVVWFEESGYACSSYSGARGRVTSGFLPSGSLAIAPPTGTLDVADWLGTWGRDEAEIKIEAAGEGRVVVSGEATWGTHDPERIERGGVHTGTIDETTIVIGAAPVVRFAMGDQPDDPTDEFRCRVSLQRVGDWLLVDDNFQCGGMNVSFDGMYARGD